MHGGKCAEGVGGENAVDLVPHALPFDDLSKCFADVFALQTVEQEQKVSQAQRIEKHADDDYVETIRWNEAIKHMSNLQLHAASEEDDVAKGFACEGIGETR